MFEYSCLQDLISSLQFGTKMHIGVLLFENFESDKFFIKRENIIHSAPFCDYAKRKPCGLERCLRCKSLAIEKAKRLKKPYWGFCINGVKELCNPIIYDNKVIGIIFVGNIIEDTKKFCLKNGFSENDFLIETMEKQSLEKNAEMVSCILESYILMLIGIYPEKAGKKYSPAVEMLKDYIDTYFDSDISLSQIAKLYSFNEKYLGRIFIKQTGTTFKQYLNKKRLENACKILRQSDQTVTEAALKSGFNNVTYFNRVFKSEFGITPKEYSGN